MEKQMILRAATCFCVAAFLTACGGGGGSSSSSTSTATVTTATLSGTAAAGTPMDGGTVTVRDSTGALVGTTTTNPDGSYTLNFEPKNFTAPFVISASGNIGGGSETFISVQPTAPSAGATQIVNATPVTHAIASRISSTGNPYDLVDAITTQKGNITAANLSTVERAFRTFLEDHLTSVGLNNSYNLLSDPFSAKFDKLLDNVKFDVSPSGVISVSSSAGQAVNDLGDATITPNLVSLAASAKTAVIAANTNPSASDKANIPAPPANTVAIGIDAFETIRTSLNDCMKLPAASRASSSVCNQYIIPSYKHDGKMIAQEFGQNGSIDFTSTSNDGMLFKIPEILRQLDMTKDAEILVVRLSGLRKDGTTRELTSVVKNNASGANTGWKLVGNQREFNTSISASVTKRISAGGANTSRYESSLSAYIQRNEDIKSVKVTGPGLPSAGIFLRNRTGCDFLTIVPFKLDGVTLVDPNTASTNDAYSNQTVPCATLYRFQAAKISDGTPITPSSSQWLFANPQKTDAQVLAIKANDVYTFEITKTNNDRVIYLNRLRAKPITIKEVPKIKFVDFTSETNDLMNASSPRFFNGGNAPKIAWTTPINTALPSSVSFFHPAGTDQMNVPYGSSFSTVLCSNNTQCNGSNYKPITLTTSSQYFFQVIARNRYDLQIHTQLVR
jgi:hypothetical protein